MLKLLLLMWFTITSALDISTVKSKLFTCTEFEILKRDDIQNILKNVYECMWDTHLFRITEESIHQRLKNPIMQYKNALDNLQYIQHTSYVDESNSKRELRNIQRSIVAVRMNLRYLLSESRLPTLTHLSDETNLRYVDEYLKENARYVQFVKAIPFKTYMEQISELVSHSESIQSALDERDAKKIAFEKAMEDFRNEIIEQYKSYTMKNP